MPQTKQKKINDAFLDMKIDPDTIEYIRRTIPLAPHNSLKSLKEASTGINKKTSSVFFLFK